MKLRTWLVACLWGSFRHLRITSGLLLSKFKFASPARRSLRVLQRVSIDGDSCEIPDDGDDPFWSLRGGPRPGLGPSDQAASLAPRLEDVGDSAFYSAVPLVIIPIVAYFLYENVALAFTFFVDFIDVGRTWHPADGKAYQIAILTPTINGIIVPTISILFGTLVSSTVSTLRGRQLSIRSHLNQESCAIRTLESALLHLSETDDNSPRSISGSGNSGEDGVRQQLPRRPPFIDTTTRRLLLGRLESYLSRLISESRPGTPGTTRLVGVGSADSEITFLVTSLHGLARRQGGQRQVSKRGEMDEGEKMLVGEALGATKLLQELRSERISALQSSFPPIHYGIVALLGGSILLCFMVETDQETLLFLDAMQLRALFSVLIGVLSSTAFLLYDLTDPFRGSYRITPTTAQLFTIRDSMAIDRLCSFGGGDSEGDDPPNGGNDGDGDIMGDMPEWQ